jgi:hypothetical protein
MRSGAPCLTGLTLIFLIGGRFLLAPDAGEAGFGIHVQTHGDHAFHYIKGIRDIFGGLVIIVLLAKEYRALGYTLLCVALVPMVDFAVVLSQPQMEMAKLLPHFAAVVLGLALGVHYLRRQ